MAAKAACRLQHNTIMLLGSQRLCSRHALLAFQLQGIILVLFSMSGFTQVQALLQTNLKSNSPLIHPQLLLVVPLLQLPNAAGAGQ